MLSRQRLELETSLPSDYFMVDWNFVFTENCTLINALSQTFLCPLIYIYNYILANFLFMGFSLLKSNKKHKLERQKIRI